MSFLRLHQTYEILAGLIRQKHHFSLMFTMGKNKSREWGWGLTSNDYIMAGQPTPP